MTWNRNFGPFRKIYVAAFLAASTNIGLWTVFTSCAKEDDVENKVRDIKPPTINVLRTSVDITGVEEIRISGSELRIGDIVVASWSDEVTKNCQVKMTIDGVVFNSGNIPTQSWLLTVTVTDEAGNSKSATIKLVMEEIFPEVTIAQTIVNIFGGSTIQIADSQLLIDGDVVASWSDKKTAKCKVAVLFNKKEVKDGDSLDEAGLLTITVTNDQGKSSTAEITLTNDAIYGLENLKNAQMQVDQEINLLNWLTLADGVDLVKTQVEIDAKRSDIDPSHYTPSYPWKCNIIFTLKWKSWNTAEVKVDNLTINALEYNAMQIDNIKPEDILPFLKEIVRWDKDIYKHIEHLRIAEATKVRDMMWKYGSSKYTPEQYQELMSRLNTGMVWENPIWYDNYEVIGRQLAWSPSTHAHVERNIIDNLIKHANFKISNSNSTSHNRENLYNLCKSDANKINIMWCSIWYNNKNKKEYESHNDKKYKEYDKQKNRLVFHALWNISRSYWIIKNKAVQEDYDLPDEHSRYTDPSRAHSKNDYALDRHLMVTVATDKNGDIDQTDETVESSLFPVWFHDKVLFSGRSFPIHADWDYWWCSWKYPTSDTNYLNVAMADLCFQMKADIRDIDELLEMMRSTALTDYIRFDLNGDGDTDDKDDNYSGQPESQPLQLINPAGVFKKYLMPQDLPTSVSMNINTTLEKGSYLGLVFDIPGAEVNINGEWTAYSDTNQELIKVQNPFALEWRLNGDLLRKMGYKKGDTVTGTIIAIDDQYNGLSLSTEITISVTE